jgi:hypothetical protein
VGKRVYLFGGLSRETLGDLSFFDFGLNTEWHKIPYTVEEETIADARYGHTASVFGSEIVYYGGCKIIK